MSSGAERLLTLRQCAAQLGISTRSVWAMLAAGRFGPDLVRLGRCVRIRATELDRWICAGCPDRAAWSKMREP